MEAPKPQLTPWCSGLKRASNWSKWTKFKVSLFNLFKFSNKVIATTSENVALVFIVDFEQVLPTRIRGISQTFKNPVKYLRQKFLRKAVHWFFKKLHLKCRLGSECHINNSFFVQLCTLKKLNYLQPVVSSFRTQVTDLHFQSIDWFLYDWNMGLGWGNSAGKSKCWLGVFV